MQFEVSFLAGIYVHMKVKIFGDTYMILWMKESDNERFQCL